MAQETKSPLYALVAYVRDPVGRFVEGLRQELYPEHAHLAAHVTVLPPRELRGTEAAAIAELQRIAARFNAFDVEFGEAESFIPTTPTVFLRVSKSAHRFRDMHEAFSLGALQCEEPWPYMPHMTIAKMPDEADAQRALSVARQRWAGYKGEKSARVLELVFVREGETAHWADLATMRLKEV